MTETRTYRGWIGEHANYEYYEDLLLTEKHGPLPQASFGGYVAKLEPLAKVIADDIECFGNYVTVRYFIADAERTLDELTEDFVRTLAGDADAEYRARYSDITGYLWTDEDLKIGGHDLLAELRSAAGKFLHLEITYSETPLGVEAE